MHHSACVVIKSMDGAHSIMPLHRYWIIDATDDEKIYQKNIPKYQNWK